MIINENYKNVFKLLLLVQHISFYLNFTMNYEEKIGNTSNASKN